MTGENTIVYSYNKDTKIYTINDKEMQKINRKLKERFTLKQENKQLKLDFDLYKDNHIYKNYEVERKDKQLDLYKSVIEELDEFVKAFHQNRDCFKWCEQDYIDVVEEFEKILDKAKGSE